jgi:nicotinamide riboside kinase
MIKVGISGVPGSGKTSLARALASTCRRDEQYKNVELVSEYARSYISKHGSIDHLWEQHRVTEKQIDWEDSICQSTDILITDSPIYIGFLYAIELVDFSKSKDVMLYNDLFKKLTNLGNRYNLIVHLDPTLEPVEDGVRPAQHFDKIWRETSNSSLLSILSMFGQKNVKVISNTNMDERIEACLHFLRVAL